MYAIIGGSGFEKFDGFQTVEKLLVETPFGMASSGLKKVKIGEHEALFLSRHGEHHELLPTEVNYRANIYALKKYGAKAILSFSAVGSLRKEFKPGDMVLTTQYIDRTKGVRKSTFLGEGIVGHVSLAHPVCKKIEEAIRSLAPKYNFDCHFGQTYICIEGPYFSTKAESNTYRQMGADIIGMTHFPEFALAREAGMTYLPCCFVTDYDCWDDSIPHVTLEEVIKVMRNNNAKAFKMAQDILATGDEFYKNCDCRSQGLRAGLMTPREAIPANKMAWLEVLLAQ
jgi:5'-methylthioadenosine phosphorylase